MADQPGRPGRTTAQQAGDAAETAVAERLAERWLARPGPERPCRSARARPRGGRPGSAGALVIVEVRWRADRAFGLPEETVDTGSARGSGPPRTASGNAGRCRTGAASRRCRCGSTSSSWSRAAGSGITGTPSDGAPRSVPAGPVLHSRPAGLALTPVSQIDSQIRRPRQPAWSTHADRSDRDGAGQEPRGPPAPGDEVRGGTNRQEVAPCRPSRCGSCSRPVSTSAIRPAAGTPRCARSSSPSATGSTSSTWPRPSSGWTSRSSSSARRSPVATWSSSSAPRSRPRSRSPRRRLAPASPTSTSAGSAGCSPTS